MDDDDDDHVDSFIWAVPGINVSLGGSRAAVALAEVTPNCVFESHHHEENDDVEGDDMKTNNSPIHVYPLPLPQLT